MQVRKEKSEVGGGRASAESQKGAHFWPKNIGGNSGAKQVEVHRPKRIKVIPGQL